MAKKLKYQKDEETDRLYRIDRVPGVRKTSKQTLNKLKYETINGTKYLRIDIPMDWIVKLHNELKVPYQSIIVWMYIAKRQQEINVWNFETDKTEQIIGCLIRNEELSEFFGIPTKSGKMATTIRELKNYGLVEETNRHFIPEGREYRILSVDMKGIKKLLGK